MYSFSDNIYALCDYKYVLRVLVHCQLEYDSHYYSILYTYQEKPAMTNNDRYSRDVFCMSAMRMLKTFRYIKAGLLNFLVVQYFLHTILSTTLV